MLFERLFYGISNLPAQLWCSGKRIFLTGCGIVGFEFDGVCSESVWLDLQANPEQSG